MPTYNEMAHEAIKALKERNGSSVQAIKKHIITTYPAIAFTPHQLRSSLKKGTEAGKFVKVKNSYKVSAEAKKPAPKKLIKKVVKKKPAKKAAKKKSATKAIKKKSAAKKKTVPKKPSTKKKTAPKKTPASKKA